MSFKKINDYNKRNELVNEYLQLKNNLRNNYINEKIGEDTRKEELVKMFRPITDEQQKQQKELIKQREIIEEKKDIFSERPIALPKVPAIENKETPIDLDTVFLGDLPQKFIGQRDSDQTYGLKIDNGKFYIGDKEVEVVDNDIYIDNTPFKGTEGIWNLLMQKEPIDYTPEDYNVFKEIMKNTNALLKINPTTQEVIRLKSNGGKKWKSVLSKVARELYPEKYTTSIGSGIPTVIIPCDPNDLIEKMDLLFASKSAGNTGVNDELKAIVKRLYNLKVIDKTLLKRLSDKIAI